MKRSLLLLLLCGLIGCEYIFPGAVRPKPSPQDITIVVDDSPAKCPAYEASRRQIKDRAQCWREIVAKVDAGEIQTVDELFAYCQRADQANADRFNAALQTWLEKQLGSAEDKLPPNTVDAADEIRKGFEEAAK